MIGAGLWSPEGRPQATLKNATLNTIFQLDSRSGSRSEHLLHAFFPGHPKSLLCWGSWGLVAGLLFMLLSLLLCPVSVSCFLISPMSSLKAWAQWSYSLLPLFPPTPLPKHVTPCSGWIMQSVSVCGWICWILNKTCCLHARLWVHYIITESIHCIVGWTGEWGASHTSRWLENLI